MVRGVFTYDLLTYRGFSHGETYRPNSRVETVE